jgi:peptidoglycan/LPS O-acetylase OafA/YrhL
MSESDGSVGRIPALDGLRATSIALVVLAHLAGTRHFLALSALSAFGDIGNLGVSVFFVISGYLISALLLKEHGRSQRIDLAAFYGRRAWRILPAAGLYLLIVAVVAATTDGSHVSSSDWLHALTFTMNYHQERAWSVGHLWSLSVEEQFYLWWPAAMVVLGTRRSLWLAGSAIALAPVCRVCVWFLWPAARNGIGETFPTVMDSIAVGCVLAGSENWLAARAWYRRFLVSPLFVMMPFVVVLCNAFDRHPSFYLTFGMTARNIGIAAILHWAIRRSSRVASVLLDSAGLRYGGRMSYSLYLWQQPFLNRHTTALLATFPVNIAAAVGCALVSYTCIEAPMLRLRDRTGPMGRACASRGPGLDSTGMTPAATFESIGRVNAEAGDPLHIGYDQVWVNSPFRSS